jgi:hypothetical protein
MTTQLSEENGWIVDMKRISANGSSPFRGNFRSNFAPRRNPADFQQVFNDKPT